jgi:hypothetical protein
MNQKQIDEMAEALLAQELTWSQINFAVSLARNAVAAERARFVDIVHGERGSRGDSCCIGTCDAILDELRA